MTLDDFLSKGTLLEIREYITQHGLFYNKTRNNERHSLLCAAVRNPNADVMAHLLTIIGTGDNICTQRCGTLCSNIVLNNTNPDVFACALRAGAFVNARGELGQTVGWYSVYMEDSSSLRLAIEYGLDINQEDASGCCAWEDWFASFGDFDRPNGQILQILYMSGAVIDTHRLSVNLDGAPDLPLPYKRLWIEFARGFTDDYSGDEFISTFLRESYALIRLYNDRISAVCAALQNLRMPVLLLCEIIEEMLSFWPRLRRCDIWARASAVRHFHEKRLIED